MMTGRTCGEGLGGKHLILCLIAEKKIAENLKCLFLGHIHGL